MDSFRGDPENEAKPPCPGGFCINMKIHELFEGFLKDCEADGLHPYTRHHHEKICHKVIAPALEGIEIESLLPVHANRIIEFASRFSKSLPERAILTFRKLVRYAKNCRYPVGVIAEEIKIPKYKRQHDPRAWSKQEISQIRSEILKDYSGELSKHTPLRQRQAHPIVVAPTRALIETMLHSGIRLSEALSADIENIDWEKEELRVEDCKAKGSWKTVYLHGAIKSIRAYLDLRTDNNSALFVSADGKRLLGNTAQSALKRPRFRWLPFVEMTSISYRRQNRTTSSPDNDLSLLGMRRKGKFVIDEDRRSFTYQSFFRTRIF